MPAGTSLVAQPQREKNLSWGEVDWMIELAVSKMRERRYLPERIVPIGGGGLIPAALMAYRFYKKDRLPVCIMPPVYVSSYTPEHKRGAMSVHWFVDLSGYDCERTLFVDDICDTGHTLAALQFDMPKSHYYAMVTKISGQPNWYSTLDTENFWWNFPWEKVSTEKVGPKVGA